MDQQALDDAYDQEIWAPNRALIVERRKAASERARAILAVQSASPTAGRARRARYLRCGIKGRRSTCSFTAAPGEGTSRGITLCKPSRSSRRRA